MHGDRLCELREDGAWSGRVKRWVRWRSSILRSDALRKSGHSIGCSQATSSRLSECEGFQAAPVALQSFHLERTRRC
jgi:hypothetical protein